MAGLGEILRRTREQQGLTLEEAEVDTRIRKKYLIALEAEDYESLPAPVYIKGFIRNYASFLDLNPDEVLKLYSSEEGPATMPAPPQLKKPSQGYAVQFSIVIVLGIMLSLGVYFFKESASNSPSEPTVFIAIPTVTSTPANTATPTQQPFADKVEITARAIERTWLAVTVDGNQVFSGFLEIGQSQTWTGKDRVGMRVGNAGGIIITYNGDLKGIMGRPGEVINQEWTRDGIVTPSGTPSTPGIASPQASLSPQATPTAQITPRPQASPSAQITPSPQASPKASPTTTR